MRVTELITVKFMCTSQVHKYRYAELVIAKSSSLSLLVVCVCIMQCILENMSNNATCLMPQDREKQKSLVL